MVRSLLYCAALLLALGCTRPRRMGEPEQWNPTLPTAGSEPSEEPAWETRLRDAVACFATEADAQAVDKAGTPWPDSLREKIRSVVTLEYWESRGEKFIDTEGEDFEDLLKAQQDRFGKYAPLFHGRVEGTAEEIELQIWKDGPPKADLVDSHPHVVVEKDDPKCRFVPLVARHSRALPNKAPEDSVEVDQFLFEKKMDALNQALLFLHEEMILIGKVIGLKNPDLPRGVAAGFFSQALEDEIDRQPHVSLKARVVQSRLDGAYGDYYRLFLADVLGKPPSGYHPYSRYRSLGSLLSLIRDRKTKCLEEHDYDHQPKEIQEWIQKECSAFALKATDLTPLLNDEQAFLYLARWVLDPAGAIDTSENFVVWDRDHPQAETPYQRKELQRACDYLKKRLPVPKPLLAKGLAYCSAIGLIPSTRSPGLPTP